MASFTLLSFGDVFNYKEKDYVYLARTADIFYTARILNKSDTHEVKTMADRAAKKGNIQNALYCFVMLDTEEFRDRMAHLHNPDRNDVNAFMEKYCTLESKDLLALKKEILDENTLVPRQLKDLVRDIEIPA